MKYYCRVCSKNYSEQETMIRFQTDFGVERFRCVCGNDLTSCMDLFKYRLFWDFDCDNCTHKFECYTTCRGK